jgi:hypothetical protein
MVVVVDVVVVIVAFAFGGSRTNDFRERFQKNVGEARGRSVGQ